MKLNMATSTEGEQLGNGPSEKIKRKNILVMEDFLYVVKIVVNKKADKSGL